MSEPFGTVGIVGTGLIGASLGLALRGRKAARRVVGVDLDPQARAVAHRIGAADEVSDDPGVLRDAEVVMVAVPPEAVADVTLEVAAVAPAGAVLCDVASVKSPIVRELDRRLPGRVRYIGGHPMAGSEARGPHHADAALLAGRPFVLTPTERTDPAAVAVMTDLVERVGMQPVLLSPEDHDALVAQVSHLPYLVAAALVAAASDRAAAIAGPAFEAFRRVAASPADLWVQICRANRQGIAQALRRFREELDLLEKAMAGDSLDAVLRRAQARAGGRREE
ncbi:MAG: prephenate dehydrogenase [Armatimonadota bacterium]|nr:prephenate dehydrogenase [Armatimonadota bacterium]MDR7436387.1 prephenate dehydrogenase [Armatimonadota bacterium]MDR7471744.1 prephenate dehydrogenase [Armatimonadota bacterium]MDR7506284.1 prephenate dehydrogenase [Armatimonadota bacterium]MDR7508255.1 prephenate dehydrogenase [Armatimonadota bacterium]